MTSSDETSAREETLLTQFIAELEMNDDTEDILARFCARYPELESDFRNAVKMRSLLDVPHNAAETNSIPDRLGDFRLIRRMQVGGMGEVYEAVQEPLGRRVAIKIVKRNCTTPALQERFLREQRVLARLHQTHVVPVFAAGQQGPIQYFAMPYIQGAALHHVLLAANRLQGSCDHPSTPTLRELVEMSVAIKKWTTSAICFSQREWVHNATSV